MLRLHPHGVTPKCPFWPSPSTRDTTLPSIKQYVPTAQVNGPRSAFAHTRESHVKLRLTSGLLISVDGRINRQ